MRKVLASFLIPFSGKFGSTVNPSRWKKTLSNYRDKVEKNLTKCPTNERRVRCRVVCRILHLDLSLWTKWNLNNPEKAFHRIREERMLRMFALDPLWLTSRAPWQIWARMGKLIKKGFFRKTNLPPPLLLARGKYFRNSSDIPLASQFLVLMWHMKFKERSKHNERRFESTAETKRNWILMALRRHRQLRFMAFS
jgi:hypothetical protein